LAASSITAAGIDQPPPDHLLDILQVCGVAAFGGFAHEESHLRM